MKTILTKIFIFCSICLCAQFIENFEERFLLPNQVSETSGLLFYNNKLITHNDSGDGANLYEIDIETGKITRTITVSNATNVDWEDITQDKTHIYVADFGNNFGNRKDLKIYKIAKVDFNKNTTVTAEIISFSYEDQTDFSPQAYNTNFDAEAIVILEGAILIFTKNWKDLQTNVYKLENKTTTQIATKVSSANIEGLITGATNFGGKLFLTGYSLTLKPFLIYISDNRKPSFDVFSSGFSKENFDRLENGNQVEGITNDINGNLYISREYYESTTTNTSIKNEQKVFSFTDTRTSLLSTNTYDFGFSLYPNPTKNFLQIKTEYTVENKKIYNSLGKELHIDTSDSNNISIKSLPKGIYLLKIQFFNGITTTKQFIKN